MVRINHEQLSEGIPFYLNKVHILYSIQNIG